MVGVVERRTDQVVHSGVGDDEGFGAVLFDDEDAGEKCAGLSDDKAAGFEEKMGVLIGETFIQSCGVFFDLLVGVEVRGAVVDAEAAACIDVANVVAVLAEFGDETGDSSERGGKGIDLTDLRADVDRDACGIEPFRIWRLCGRWHGRL